MTDFAASLRPTVRTGILSNSADGARREEQDRHGFEQLVDVIVYSHEAGVAKPDPRAFLILCQQLGVAPGELAFAAELSSRMTQVTSAGVTRGRARALAWVLSAASAERPGS